MTQRRADVMTEAPFDAVVVGGGPTGLNAAMVLGRACKRVLLCDDGPPRNALAEELHGFITRDGTPPAEFRRMGREELLPYDVEQRRTRVTRIEHADSGPRFRLTLASGEQVRTSHVVVAVGLIDEPIDLPGMREVWGRSAFQCPHCHGWERRGRAWGALSLSQPTTEFLLLLRGWTSNLVAFTHGVFEPDAALRQRLEKKGVVLVTQPIRRIVSETGGVLRGIETTDGRVTPLDVLFHMPKQSLPPVVRDLGLELNDFGFVKVDGRQQTSIPGIYAAGDVTTMAQAAILGAAAGAMAGFAAIHAMSQENEHPMGRAA